MLTLALNFRKIWVGTSPLLETFPWLFLPSIFAQCPCLLIFPLRITSSGISILFRNLHDREVIELESLLPLLDSSHLFDSSDSRTWILNSSGFSHVNLIFNS